MKKKNLSAKKKIHNFYTKKLKDPKINNIYSNFKKKLSENFSGVIGVSVSGGTDSLALSFLAKCYSLEKKKKAYFFIVDHKIRKNSSFEANYVRNKLKKFDINSDILTFSKVRKKSNLQSFARDNRYSLISKKSLSKKIDFVLTAHHQNDLLENFFIRLLRGSGLKGLVSFGKLKSKVKYDDKIYILRPLIDVSKKDLIYITKNTFNFSIEDPSNQDEKFLRVKVRKLISKLEQEGLSFTKFKISLKNLNKSNHAIDFYVNKNINNNSRYSKITKSIFLNEEFFKQPNEVVFRSFTEIIQMVGKKNTYSRGTKIDNLLNYLKVNNKQLKKTLSGCIITKLSKTVIISPEK